MTFNHCFSRCPEDIYNANLSDCHIEILSQFQVRANLVVPVVKGGELWGLLCIHQCSNPRRWKFAEIEFIRKIADYFAVALQQTEQLEQLQQQAQLLERAQAEEKALVRQQSLVKITNRIRQSLDLPIICQTATDEVRRLLQADRVTIYRFNSDWSGNFLFESVGDEWQPLVRVAPTIEDTHLMETQGGRYAQNQTFAVADIYAVGHSECHIQLLEDFQAKAYAIAPIFQGERLWGLLTAFQNEGPRQWEANEVELLAQIGEQLGIALQQSEFVEQIQVQSEKLEQTLQHLQQSQIELVQKEKMAALGHLIAGVAHEINNPLGAIQGAATNIEESLEVALRELPYLHQRLSETEQASFFQLVACGRATENVSSSVENVMIRRKIMTELQQLQVSNPRYLAGLLLDMGVKEDLEFLQPILHSQNLDWALRLAYNLTRGFVNNRTILGSIERTSKIVFALKSYAHVEQQEVQRQIQLTESLETTLQIYYNQLRRFPAEKVPFMIT